MKQQGHSLGAQDSSYLVHLYENDPNFLVNLNGMFHGLIADQSRGTVTLFNDRYGMHRIYYHEAKDAFYFAAEAKAILAVLPELRTRIPKGWASSSRAVAFSKTGRFSRASMSCRAARHGLFRMAPRPKKTAISCRASGKQQASLDPEGFYQELRDAFSRNLPRYFSGRQQVGMTLTGGMDTRVIMAWHKPAPKSLPCYTFGGMLRDCEDVRIALRVANVCQQTHEVLTVGQEFLSRFPYYAERTVHLTEGGVDVYRASDLYVSERARRLAPAKVVGTYGSEIVRHAVMFKAVTPSAGLYSPNFLPFVAQAGSTYSELRRQHPVTFAAFRQSPWYHSRILSLEQSQLSVRSPYLDNDFVRTMYLAPQDNSDDVRLRLIRDGDATLAAIRTDRGIGGNSGRLVSAAARGFHGVYRSRPNTPTTTACRSGSLESTTHLSPLHLERLFLGRHKLLHFRVWYRDTLSGLRPPDAARSANALPALP